ncbi:2-hydroxychromene-2-carboxylate isomerase [Roseospira marina]|uniref:2-hydroxychromene-2-carboxylate isomerase n=1 Tax=Roseospira marina TaxID=140057 RepID=A0A5M6IFN2_9PROT|nr:2-hydroxychromene-2-carboxylate isomerase [Roseospira marina]KAA5606942.1 2-hydroxychromene-2-carboxylate isomerase [Roseospira marina]MBB4312883.1 2-hydroxychromene-2-carboxylate isomerase [Roseospira marina]MBB5086344.1 2-hydroxychromene-2-carboxylate isomerase [Roseospira marina]
MPEPIDFYFDFSSPYSYVAANLIDALADRHIRSVTWRPILLGPVFEVSGNRPLNAQPMKGDYMRHDVPRLCRRHGIPFAWPEPFPIATVAAARAVYALWDQDAEQAIRFAKAVFRAYFANGRNIGETDGVLAVAADEGIDAAALGQAIQDPAIKARTKAAVDHAIKLKVCGAPFFLVDEEPFWGVDRLPLMDEWMARGGW